jgi:hypothetical protein
MPITPAVVSASAASFSPETAEGICAPINANYCLKMRQLLFTTARFNSSRQSFSLPLKMRALVTHQFNLACVGHVLSSCQHEVRMAILNGRRIERLSAMYCNINQQIIFFNEFVLCTC